MYRFLSSLILLLWASTAPAANFYTATHNGIYQVDLTTGDTRQVASYGPDANGNLMAGFTYDAYTGTLGAVVAEPWLYVDVCGNDTPWNAAPFTSWIWRFGATYQGVQIDTTTWQPTGQPAIATVAGAMAEENDSRKFWCEICDTWPWLHVTTAASDPSTGQWYTFHSYYAQHPNDPNAPPDGARWDVLPTYYAAVSPIDGTIWTIQGDKYLGASPGLIQLATDQQTVLASFDAAPTGQGPIAFDPDGNLWRYAYDGNGNAWLNRIDVSTGQVVATTPTFWAPAESMWFGQ